MGVSNQCSVTFPQSCFSYAHELQAASEHMVSFIDGQNKAVVGTTYKELKQLVGQINQCGYFDKTDAEEEAEESPEAARTFNFPLP